MRLPLLPGQTDSAAIDEKRVDEMIDYALSHGVNYHTAIPRLVSRSYFSFPCWRVQSR